MQGTLATRWMLAWLLLASACLEFSDASTAAPPARATDRAFAFARADSKAAPATVDVIEFYNPAQDHYFISSLQPDIDALDSGRLAGWVRTGMTFKAYPQPTAGASPVCRFYIPPANGDSHFFSASPAECAQTAAKFPNLVLETSTAMYIDLPDAATGTCPAGDIPVYRVWDKRADSNHRYMTDPGLRTQMVGKGWVAEGYGPDQVIMCSPAGLRGIYIYTNDIAQLTSAAQQQLVTALGLAGIDGVAIVIGWNAIEPAMNQFDWSLLDRWIAQAVSLGKKIDLVVPAGSAIPAWLFQPAPSGAGAKALSFTISPHSGATGQCDAETIAAPWDTAFLQQWDAMLAALRMHLQAAGTYNAITLVRLTAINRTTEELRLPAETAQSTGLACVTDAISTWQQAGYRPSLLQQAWTSILASYRKSFPDKIYAVSLIPTSAAFPPIDDTGAIIHGTAGPDLTQALIAAANQVFPGRLVVQFDFLMPGEAPSPDVVQDAQTLHSMAAFQTNEYLGGQGAACSEPVTNPTPCTAATFLTMLETGIYPLGRSDPLRAQYIEVFRANALAFPQSIQQAHTEILAP